MAKKNLNIARKLCMACRAADPQKVKELLEAGASPDSEAVGFFRPALIAAMGPRAGDSECLRLLLEAGADVDCRSDIGTPLMNAALLGHAESVALLLEAGADPFCYDETLGTALDLARLSLVSGPHRYMRLDETIALLEEAMMASVAVPAPQWSPSPCATL